MPEGNRAIGGAAVWRAAISSRPFQLQERIGPIIGDNFVWVLVLVMGVWAGTTNPVFWSSENLLNILNANASLGALVVGLSFVLISGNINISFESNLLLSGLVGGILMMEHPTLGGFGLPWLLALATMLVLSSLVGLINGFLTVRFRMNSLMVTLAMMVMLLGWALVLGSGRRITGLPDGFRYVGSAEIGSVPVAVLFMIVVFVIVGVVLSRTVFGAILYAVGGNRRAARSAGINDGRVIITAYVILGFFAGLSAFILMGRFGTASYTIPNGAIFPVAAAAGG